MLSSPYPADYQEDSPWDATILAIIIVIGFFLRFAWLDVPTLIRDEALVLMAAEHSPLFILKRALTTDAHPPYFYYLAKLILVLGKSDFALRFLSAASGTAAIWCMHRFIRRISSSEAALIGAGILACYFLHIQISRTIRPHPFIVLLTIVSLSWLLDFLRSPGRITLIKVTVLNLLLLLLHFNTLLVVGTQMTLVAMMLPGVWRTQAKLWFILFLGISSASLLVNLPIFLFRLGKFPGFDLNISMAWTLERTLVNLNKMMGIVPLGYSPLAGWALFLLGTILLTAKDRFAATVLLSGIFMPLIVLILAKYGLFYEPWHISFIIPCLIAVCAHALAWILRSPIPARTAALLIPMVEPASFFPSSMTPSMPSPPPFSAMRNVTKKSPWNSPGGSKSPMPSFSTRFSSSASSTGTRASSLPSTSATTA